MSAAATSSPKRKAPPCGLLALLLSLALLVSTSPRCRSSCHVEAASAAGGTTAAGFWSAASRRTRRWLNLGSTFGSALHSPTVYDRIAGHPVFAVTTPWGSPYMNMEKISDTEETIPSSSSSSSSKTPSSLSEEQSELRMVALYFLDPSDALSMHGEMKQMDNMAKADVRLTCFSLGKALRQASCLGDGLTTGQPPDETTGRLTDNGTLRYKMVPSKRQLYYAARCHGRERVGLQSESAAADAAAAVTGNSALEAANLLRRRQKAERKVVSNYQKSAVVPHMEGYTGVPVFYCPALHKQLPLLKRILTGVRQEKPFFFNYEDLERAWTDMKERRRRGNAPVPDQPVNVEVFNLWDVLSSMDRQQYLVRSSSKYYQRWLPRRIFARPSSQLLDITFVPNSDAVHYKDSISRRGNGKARLRPMR